MCPFYNVEEYLSTLVKLVNLVRHIFQGSMIVQVQAVDGDAGVGNEVTYEIISGQFWT